MSISGKPWGFCSHSINSYLEYREEKRLTLARFSKFKPKIPLYKGIIVYCGIQFEREDNIMFEWALATLIIASAALLIVSIIKLRQSSVKEQREIDNIYFSMMNGLKSSKSKTAFLNQTLRFSQKQRNNNYLPQRENCSGISWTCTEEDIPLKVLPKIAP